MEYSNISKAALVCCGYRDQAMLPIFIYRWKELYPEVKLWLAEDLNDKVTIAHDLEVLHIDWKKDLVNQFVSIMLATEADIVAKLDVDSYHLKRFLFDDIENSEYVASGIQWFSKPGIFLGIAYTVKRDALLKISSGSYFNYMDGKAEDVCMCHSLLRAYPNKVKLHSFNEVSRVDTWDGSPKSVIHCGIYGHDLSGRKKAYEELMEFGKKKL